VHDYASLVFLIIKLLQSPI